MLEPLFCDDLITIGKCAIANEYGDLATGGLNRVEDTVNEDGTEHCIEAQYGIFLDQLRYFSFIYLGLYIAFNTVQLISHLVERAEETSTYSLSGFCTVNCRPTARNYQLSHVR